MGKIKLALGTAQLGLPYGVANTSGQPGQAAALEILQYAWAGGIDLLDTAAGYGTSENVIGAFVRRAAPAGLKVCTKAELPEDADERDVLPLLKASLLSSLQKLGLPRVYAFMLHHGADLLRHKAAANALREVLRLGLADKVGASVYTPAEAEALLAEEGLAIIQIPYNCWDGRWDTFLVKAQSRGVEVHARSLYLQGLMLLPEAEAEARVAGSGLYVRRLVRAAAELGVSPAAYAFAFAHGNRHIQRIVVGCETREQLAANLAQAAAPALGNMRIQPFQGVPERILNPSLW